LLARLGRVPRVGETLDVDDVDVEILEGERRRVQRVRMRRRSPLTAEE
jgi:CBS domain containing-hemolysin-like protein